MRIDIDEKNGERSGNWPAKGREVVTAHNLSFVVGDHLEYENIAVSERGIFERQGRTIATQVMQPGIERVRLAYTTPANRPVMEAVVGGAFTVTGLVGLWWMVQNLKSFRYTVILVMLGVFGMSMLRDVLKRRFVLCISARGTVHKLAFSKKALLEEIKRFSEFVQAEYGIQIEIDASSSGSKRVGNKRGDAI